MEPTIEVYAGILQLIGEFAIGCDEWRIWDSDDIKADGLTITRTSQNKWSESPAYGAETVAAGQRSWRIQIEKRRYGMHIGVGRNCDRTNGLFFDGGSGIAYGTVPLVVDVSVAI